MRALALQFSARGSRLVRIGLKVSGVSFFTKVGAWGLQKK